MLVDVAAPEPIPRLFEGASGLSNRGFWTFCASSMDWSSRFVSLLPFEDLAAVPNPPAPPCRRSALDGLPLPPNWWNCWIRLISALMSKGDMDVPPPLPSKEPSGCPEGGAESCRSEACCWVSCWCCCCCCIRDGPEVDWFSCC
jgi:hypothetical protein